MTGDHYEFSGDELRKLKDDLCLAAHGRLPDGKTCVNCDEVPEQGVNMFTEAGWREFGISGLCERCFDNICAEDDDEEEDGDA